MADLKELAAELRQQEEGLLEQYETILAAAGGETERQLANEILRAQKFQLSTLELIEKEMVPEKFLSFGTISSDEVNLRLGPSPHQERIRVLDQNTRVIIMENEGNWSHVQTADGETGWVFKDYVRPDL